MTQQTARTRAPRQAGHGFAARSARLRLGLCVGLCAFALVAPAVNAASSKTPQKAASTQDATRSPVEAGPTASLSETVEAQVALEIEPDAVAEAEASIGAGAGGDLRGRLVQGGWVMLALLGCSLLVVAVAIERAAATRRSLVWPKTLRTLVARADGVDRDALRVQVKDPASVGERLVCAGLRAEENGIADAAGVVAEIGAREVARLRRGLPLLANLANIATMLGLFGTVLGMIDAFELIAAEGTGDPRIVADGIFKALVTTAAGLAIGIAALAIHAMLSGRVDGRIRELEDGLGALFDPAAAPAGTSTRQAVQGRAGVSGVRAS